MMKYFDLLFLCILVVGVVAQKPDEGYSREQLQPLTNFRQQHRRTIDGRLCAAAFVQNRKSYTGCTDAPNPTGESGRPWCYVEAQASPFEHRADSCFETALCLRSCWVPMLARRHGIIAVSPLLLMSPFDLQVNFSAQPQDFRIISTSVFHVK